MPDFVPSYVHDDENDDGDLQRADDDEDHHGEEGDAAMPTINYIIETSQTSFLSAH